LLAASQRKNLTQIKKQMHAKHADAHWLNGHQGVSFTVVLLGASGPRFGMLLNFGGPRLGVKRLANDL
jgi:hypothetical protein